jgi:hypothetical protein
MPIASTPLIDVLAAVLFAIAVIHTFSVKFFERLAHTHPRHAGIWHLLGEIEVVFGFWAMVLMAFYFGIAGADRATEYLDTRNFTEPMFVFAIMVIAASRPVLEFANAIVRGLVRMIPMQSSMALYFVVLAFVPLLGSFITEPAAMTIAALMIRDLLFSRQVSNWFKYVTLGVLFVNISIGGTLTPFAAPPVLMVAAKWNWDILFMLSNFGWKAAIAVVINTIGAMIMLRTELRRLDVAQADAGITVPLALVAVHLMFLVSVVVFAHHPSVFISLLLFFMGVATAYRHHQNPLILREGLLVAFFLAGLVVLGGKQQWWLQPALMQMSEEAVFIGAAALTAVTDNAALTYLGSLVEGLSPAFQYSLVAGAVAGGGLTVIANAPNPAGVAILRERFDEQTIHPLGLLAAALPPTIVALLAFRFL